MKRNKDFKEYSEKRIGKDPRSLIINTFLRSLDVLMEKHKENGSEVIICEFGFNHANDSRYMCELLYKRYGTSGWKYFGYDHKDYFMPENFGLDIGEKYYENLNLVPCTFEEIAKGEVSLPPYISFLYSSKSLSLCDDKHFVPLINKITSKVEENGFISVSLHTRNEENADFKTPEEYLDILLNNQNIKGERHTAFNGFEVEYASLEPRQTFAVYAKKTGTNTLTLNNNLVLNKNGEVYKNIE